jgi:hypothetical protein
MNGVAVVHRISCTAIEPRHGRGGTARRRGISIASVHDGTFIQIRARPLDMAHLATTDDKSVDHHGLQGHCQIYQERYN